MSCRTIEPCGGAPTASVIAQESIVNAVMVELIHRTGYTAKDFKFNHPGGALGGKGLGQQPQPNTAASASPAARKAMKLKMAGPSTPEDEGQPADVVVAPLDLQDGGFDEADVLWWCQPLLLRAWANLQVVIGEADWR